MAEFTHGSAVRVSKAVREVEGQVKNNPTRRARYFGGPWTITRFAKLSETLEAGAGNHATARFVRESTPDSPGDDSSWETHETFEAYAPPMMQGDVELASGDYVTAAWMLGHWYVINAECGEATTGDPEEPTP